MAVLVTAIHVLRRPDKTWMAGTRPVGRPGHDEVGSYSKLWAGTAAGPGAAAGAAGGATVTLTCEPSAGV